MTEPVPPFDVRAIAAYQARNNTEVSLEVGKIYHVQQTDGKGLWWQTKSDITGTFGWFPASYTEVIQSQPPPVQQQAYAPAPTPQQQYVQPAAQPQPAAQQSQQAASQPHAPVGTSETGQVPPPSRPPSKEKGDSRVFVKLQVIEARGLRGEAAKTNPIVFIFRRDVMDDRGVQLFQTQQAKKTITPKWNELFQINVKDAESEVLCVRFCNGKKFEPKGKKFLGEITFPLRSAVRDFEHPNFKYKWYPITGGKGAPPGEKCTGECLVYIEFIDTTERHGPKDFKHESHVGWSKEGGFDINNIPPEWKKIFKQVGIRRADLENNPELASQVLDIMQKSDLTGDMSGSASPAAQHTQMYQPPPTPQPQYQQAYSPAPSPMPTPMPTPAPTPMPAPTPAPAPPAPGMGMHPAPRPAPAPTPAPAPPPPPTPSYEQHHAAHGGGDDGGGMSDLQKALMAKKQQGLRKVETSAENKPPPPASEGNALSNALLAALSQHRKDIEGNDKDDDWGDDWN